MVGQDGGSKSGAAWHVTDMATIDRRGKVAFAMPAAKETNMYGFCRTVAALALSISLMAMAGCSRPTDAVIPTDPALWETQLAPSMKKMSPEERTLLDAYLVRITAGRIIRGGKGVPPDTTIAAAIEDQREVSERSEKALKAQLPVNKQDGGGNGKDHHLAEDWSALNVAPGAAVKAGEVTTGEIDAASIRERDGYRQVWWRQNFIPPRPNADTGGVVGTIFHLSLLDCKNNKSAFLIKASYTALSDKRALLRNESRTKVEVLEQMKPVVPGSFAESALRFACTHPVQ